MVSATPPALPGPPSFHLPAVPAAPMGRDLIGLLQPSAVSPAAVAVAGAFAALMAIRPARRDPLPYPVSCRLTP